MTAHAVAAISPGKNIARETSCHCKEYLRNGIYTFSESVRTEDWVAAVYDTKWYVGKVLEADPIDSDALVHACSRQRSKLAS